MHCSHVLSEFAMRVVASAFDTRHEYFVRAPDIARVQMYQIVSMYYLQIQLKLYVIEFCI